jgi:hypothetical protein
MENKYKHDDTLHFLRELLPPLEPMYKMDIDRHAAARGISQWQLKRAATSSISLFTKSGR